MNAVSIKSTGEWSTVLSSMIHEMCMS